MERTSRDRLGCRYFLHSHAPKQRRVKIDVMTLFAKAISLLEHFNGNITRIFPNFMFLLRPIRVTALFILHVSIYVLPLIRFLDRKSLKSAAEHKIRSEIEIRNFN